MLTVSELAKDLNVSVQAIYKKINKSMKNELRPYVKTVNGQKVIDERGAEIIKESFKPGLNQFKTVLNHSLNSKDKNELNTSNIEDFKPGLNQFKTVQSEENSNIINLLQDTLNILKEQINEKDLQIKEKDNQIKILQNELNAEHEHSRDMANKLAELTRNSQILLKQEQDKTALLLLEQQQNVSSEASELKTENKKGFWWFWKK